VRGCRASHACIRRTHLHLKPGQKGTKQLLAQYEDCLVCARYRYDVQQKKRFKTVELIVAERDWAPPAPGFMADTRVGVRLGFAEVEMRDRVKQVGGRRDRRRKVWEMHDTQVSRSSWESGSSRGKHLILETKTKE
jgi:hypothetical protein